jgi:cyanophycin synthetase
MNLMKLKSFILRNDSFNRLARKQITRLLIRPYIGLRNIPIIAITGTNGKTTVARLLNRIYLLAGYRVGMCCTDGVYFNDSLVTKGDYSFGHGIWKATRGRDIDIVLAEAGRGGILRYGLGFYTCRVCVVTNVYEDHLGFEGVNTLEQMATVKATIPRHTASDGFVVLNGDHPLVRPMAANARAPAIYYTMEGRQDEFDHCYYLKDGCIWRKHGSLTELFLPVDEIPVTLHGISKYNIANAMAVLAAAEGMQTCVPVPLQALKSALQEFGNDPNDNPSLLTLLHHQGIFVLLCNCKNPESFRLDVEIILKIQKHYGFDHLVGILTGPGDRTEDYFAKISGTVAPICRYFFIRQPAKRYLRTRTGEEIIRLLSLKIPKERILSTENLPIASIVDQTRQILDGKCLYVYFFSRLEAELHLSQLICEGQHIPIEIGR